MSPPFEPLESRTLLTAVPAGFTDQTIVTGLTAPTSEVVAPDGRLFVAEKGGSLRIVQNGQLLATPFLTVPVDTFSERGLDGVVLDPNFATNGFVYVYYTTADPAHPGATNDRYIHNRNRPGSDSRPSGFASAGWLASGACRAWPSSSVSPPPHRPVVRRRTPTPRSPTKTPRTDAPGPPPRR